MKICKDCEMEVDKLNLDGICHQCYIRKTNNAYLNKKNGTNNPYIPLKDIKGTKEYNRVMGRRRATLEKKNKKSQVSVTKTTYKIMNENDHNPKILYQFYYLIKTYKSDIKTLFHQRHLFLNFCLFLTNVYNYLFLMGTYF